MPSLASSCHAFRDLFPPTAIKDGFALMAAALKEEDPARAAWGECRRHPLGEQIAHCVCCQALFHGAPRLAMELARMQGIPWHHPDYSSPQSLWLLCCMGGHLPEARQMASDGALANDSAADGGNGLCSCLANGKFEFALWLIENGADPCQADGLGRSPLHFAAFHGNAQMCEKLIGLGADNRLVDFRGQRPSDAARSAGRFELAALMEGAMEASAQKNIIEAHCPHAQKDAAQNRL